MQGRGYDPHNPEHVYLREKLLRPIAYDGIDELFIQYPFQAIWRAVEEVLAAIEGGKEVKKPSGLLRYLLRKYYENRRDG